MIDEEYQTYVGKTVNIVSNQINISGLWTIDEFLYHNGIFCEAIYVGSNPTNEKGQKINYISPKLPEPYPHYLISNNYHKELWVEADRIVKSIKKNKNLKIGRIRTIY